MNITFNDIVFPFTIQELEFYLLIVVRIASLFTAAPLFSIQGVPNTTKVFLAVFISIIMINILPVQQIAYTTVLQFGGLIVKEALCGLIIGFSANIAMQIVILVGHFIDVEIGFAMANIFDPMTMTQVSITGTFYNYLILLVLLITNTHYYIINAIVYSFDLIPVGKQVFPPGMYNGILKFMADYFIIGMRIVLPFFAAILLINSVLGILARSAPQMNMFVIGLQIKVFVGLSILFTVISLLPYISEFIFNEMKEIITIMLNSMSG